MEVKVTHIHFISTGGKHAEDLILGVDYNIYNVNSSKILENLKSVTRPW